MKLGRSLLLALALVACAPAEEPAKGPQLGQFAGQWLVINYWATWCKPCIQEIPELNALAELPGVTVLGVNYDGASGAALEEQVQQLGIRFASLESDPASALGATRPVVLPTSLVVGPDGTLRATLVGPQTLQSLAQATGQALPAGAAPE